MELEEEWRPVKGYEDIFEVSNLGRIRSVERVVKAGKYGTKFVKSRILKLEMNKKGYLMTRATRKYGCKRLVVHRFVAEAFIPNPNNYPIVNHKDERKDNNVVTNLEWCTHSYNTLYGTCQQRRAIHRQRTVEMIDMKTHEVIKVFSSMKRAEEETHTPAKQISHVCRGYDKSARGYFWRYANESQGVRLYRTGNQFRLEGKSENRNRGRTEPSWIAGREGGVT